MAGLEGVPAAVAVLGRGRWLAGRFVTDKFATV
jgi:hypothetical protein